MKKYNRRKFLKTTTFSAAAISASGAISSYDSQDEILESSANYMGDFSAPKLETIRTAFIGVGARGSGHLKAFSMIDGIEVVAICDLHEDLVESSYKIVKDIGNGGKHINIAKYHGSETNWKKMLKDVRPDVVIISTNWDEHLLTFFSNW